MSDLERTSSWTARNWIDFHGRIVLIDPAVYLRKCLTECLFAHKLGKNYNNTLKI